MSMMEKKKPSTAAKLWEKVTEGAEFMLSCVIVGAGLKLGANIADILTEKFEDRFGQDNNDPITAIASAAGLTEEDIDDEDEDEDDPDDGDYDGARPEADGVSDSKAVEEEIAVVFPARDSKGRFVKRTMTVTEPEPVPAEEIVPETSEAEEPAKEEEQVEAAEEPAEDQVQEQEQEEETQQ